MIQYSASLGSRSESGTYTYKLSHTIYFEGTLCINLQNKIVEREIFVSPCIILFASKNCTLLYIQ